MKLLFILLISLYSHITFSQWQDVDGGTNNSSHGMLVWNDKLINLGSFNNPCNRVAEWDGAAWNCLGGGVGIVARAGTVWDGKLVVVGDFWNVQQPCVGCNGVAVWDGTSWTPLGNGVNNDVLSITVWNNELVIAGDFTQADGVDVARIVKWNGSVWESVGPIGSFDNDIRAMVEFEGDLWVGGDFNNVGGQGPLDGLVKYDPSISGWTGGNSGVDLIGGVNESVRVLYVNPNDGNLYMGGEFPELIDGDAAVEDFNMSGIAMYDGSNWTPLGTGLNEYCRAMHEYNGDIVAGGYFTDAGGTPANKIAKWDGSNWSAMGLGFDASGIDEYVKSAAVWNGIFFAGGAYTQAEGGPMNFISQWYEPATSAPVAWMSSSSTNLCGSGCIDFLDNSTNAPTSWTWTFPGSDTPTSSDQNPGSVCWTSAGTYTVSLEACNAIGCTTQDIDIEVGDGASVTVNNASLCSGSSAVLTATPSDAGGSYLWSTGETTQSISVSPSVDEIYTVTYTYFGCQSAPATSTVTVAPGTGFDITQNIESCENSSVTYPDATSEVITANATHVSLLTSVGGCDSTITTNVTMIVAFNETENLFVCENTTFTYPDGTTELITSGTSHVSSLTSVLGCDSIVTTNVTMNPAYNESESYSICENVSYVYPDGSSETITGNTSHSSNFTSVSGCDSIIVTNISVIPLISTSQNMSICSGDEFTYPDGTISSNILVDESHVSNLTAASGCDSIITSFIMVNPLPILTTAESGNTITVNQTGAQYVWLNCNTSNSVITGESNPSYTPLNNGSYAVEIDLNGCIDTSLCIVISTIGLDELNVNSISVYPNPVNDYLHIQSKIDISNVNYEIVDVKGKVILEGTLNTETVIDVSNINKGTYTLQLNEGHYKKIRFIKQ